MSLLKAQFCDKVWKERKKNSLSTKLSSHKNHPKTPISFSQIMTPEARNHRISLVGRDPQRFYLFLLCEMQTLPIQASKLLILSTYTQFYDIRKTVLAPFSDRPTILLTSLSPTYTLTEKSLWKSSRFWRFFPEFTGAWKRKCSQPDNLKG